MTKELYLSFPNKSRLAVTVELTDNGLLVRAIDRPDICFVLGGLTALQSAMVRQALDPLGLSPADVIRYFQQSPVLSYLAEDLKTAFKGHPETIQADYQLQQDLQAVQGLVGATQADIAERLFGDRTKTGGSYRRRILAVLGATTTSQQSTTTGQKRVFRAA
jgi:hypothetical protein